MQVNREFASKTATALALLLFACALALQAYQAKPEEQKCAIEGRVTNSVTGEPLRRVALLLTGPGRVITAESDESGRFSFQGLNQGSYSLTADRAGYAKQTYGARGSSTSGTPLVLLAGQQMKDILFKMAPAALISGRVLDEDGEPPPANTVAMAFESSYQRGVRQWLPVGAAMTNDLGEFRIPSLAAGSYLVAAVNAQSVVTTGLSAQKPGDKPESAYVFTFFPSATDAANAVPVQLAAGGEAGGTVIRLRKVNTVRITGKVAGAGEGKAVVMRLAPKGVTSSVLAVYQGKLVASQEKDGSFELKGVAPGSYMLIGLQTDAQTQSMRFGSVLLQVGNQHIDGLVLQLVPAAELAGSVVVADKTAAKLSGVQVGLEAKEYAGVGSPSATAGDDGKFTLKQILPNKFLVQVRNLPEGAYVKSMRYGDQEVSDDTIDLSGGVTGTIQVTLSMAGARVDGVVQNQESKPISGATVVLAPDSGRYSLFKEVRTGDNGSYGFKGVAPGDYKILARTDIESGAYQDPEFLKRYESKAEKVSLKESDRKTVALKVIPAE
jgi:protocatechuate 3,4-dioxygenase beta subunit